MHYIGLYLNIIHIRVPALDILRRRFKSPLTLLTSVFCVVEMPRLKSFRQTQSNHLVSSQAVYWDRFKLQAVGLSPNDSLKISSLTLHETRIPLDERQQLTVSTHTYISLLFILTFSRWREGVFSTCLYLTERLNTTRSL